MSVFVYAVVEFLEESSVDVVHRNWIESSDENMFCYWPPTVANIYSRVRNGEIPDKERWNKYRIRIFNYTDDFDKAVAYSKRAENTSNMESDDEGRQRRKPKRYQNDSDQENDVTDNVESSKKVGKSKKGKEYASQSDSDEGNYVIDNVESSKKVGKSKKRKEYASQSDSDEGNDEIEIPRKQTEMRSGSQTLVPPMPPSYPTTSFQSTPHRSPEVNAHSWPTTPVRTETEDNFRARLMIQKLNSVLQNQNEILTAIKQLAGGRGAVGDVEEVIINPLNSAKEMGEIEESLKQSDFKKKMMLFLSSQGGHSSGNCLRRILSKLGTNKLWSLYSLKGRKGKIAFEDHPLCRIAMKACIKVFPKTKVSDMEDIIIDYLKQAPHKQGGTKYKKPEPKKRKPIESDSSEFEEL